MVTNLSGGHKLEVLGRQLRVEEGARGGVEVEGDAQEHHMDDVSADADARQTPVKLRYRLIRDDQQYCLLLSLQLPL